MKRILYGNRSLTINEIETMKRIYSFMVAAVASFAAISCTQELDNNIPEQTGETVVFTAYTDGADVKANLNGKKSTWENGDKITILNGSNGFDFSTTDEGAQADFTYVGDDFSGEKFIAVYPSGNYTANVEGKTVNAYIPTYQKAHVGNYSTYSGEEGVTATLAVAYSENQSLEFKNACALLKFNVSNENITHVKFYGNNQEAITGNMLVSLDGDNSINSVVGQKTTFKWEDGSSSDLFGTWVEMHAHVSDDDKFFKAGEDNVYYIAVAPCVFTKGFAVKVKVDGVEHEIKKYNDAYTLKPNTILNLGTLTYDPNVVDASAYGLVGSFQGWDPANSIAMEYVSDGWIVARNVELYKDDAFKFVNGKTWDDVNYGASSVLEDGVPAKAVKGGSNIMVGKNGIHDLYLNPNAEEVKAICVEEYTDIKVQIKVVNERTSWTSVNMYLWYEENGNKVDITTSPGPALTKDASGNYVYELDGKYIGETIYYVFSNNGADKTDQDNLVASRNGHSLTISSLPPAKFTMTLDTSTLTTYWGTTAYLYVWTDAPKVEPLGGWPGKKMTYNSSKKEFTCDIPSEYIGKKLNFIVHNNSGWQTADKVMNPVKEEQTYKGNANLGLN